MSSLMDKTASSSTTLLLCSPPQDEKKEQHQTSSVIFDSSKLQKQPHLPTQFIWPTKDLVHADQVEELNEPLIDLEGFFKGDEQAIAEAARLIRDACTSHGFFQVTNHGVEPALISAAYDEVDSIFKLPMSKKLSIRRKPGDVCGYSGAHADRYNSKLPWKETFTFGFHGNNKNNAIGGSEPDLMVVDYFKSVLGEDFEHTGRVYQKYCEAMRGLALAIMELLGISLGVERMHYKDYFEDGSSIMRCNYYPPCIDDSLALGTGPHCDPTSLTILHQDQVGGLQVFANNAWHAVQPRRDALVINIGDTLMALTNGRYKSCLHRALVNRERERRSLVFFVNPRADKVVRPPQDLVSNMGEPRMYPDFTWSDLFEFTQTRYRSDVTTLHSFVHWLQTSSSSSPSSSSTPQLP